MLRSAVPVYTLEFFKNNGSNIIHLSIDDHLLLETLFSPLGEKQLNLLLF